jgi:hypothetical protein
MVSAMIGALTDRSTVGAGTIDIVQLAALTPGAPFCVVREGERTIADWWCVESEPSRVVTLREPGQAADLITCCVDIPGDDTAALRVLDARAQAVGSVSLAPPSLLRHARKLTFADSGGRHLTVAKQHAQGFLLPGGAAEITRTTTPTGPNRAPAVGYRLRVRDALPWPMPALLISSGLAFSLLSRQTPLRPGTAVRPKPRGAAAEIADALGGLLP